MLEKIPWRYNMSEYPYNKTIIYNSFYEMLDGLYKNHSDNDAIRYFDKKNQVSYTYKEIIRQVSSLYKYYKLNNIDNTHIGIISENRYEYVTIYLSSVFLNVIAPIDKEIDCKSLKELTEKFEIKVLFYTNKTKEKVFSSVDIDNIKLINIDEVYSNIIQRDYPVPEFFNEIENVNKDKFSVLAFTSGTTGDIKGVMLSQYNILSNLRAGLENNVLKGPTLIFLPMNHTYGFNPGVLNTLYIGGTVCLNMDLKFLTRDLKAFNPYFIGGVPMIVEGIYQNIIHEARRKNKEKQLYRMIKISNLLLKIKIDIRKLLFGNILNENLQLLFSGGAVLNPIYIKKFDELGIKLLNGYGLTECSPLIAVNREYNNIPGSVGTIIKDAKVKIAADGEILVKGPNVMLGYFNDPDATNECMVNGYFKTGDFGYTDGNILYITGRKKNLIILENGKNFSPEQVESKLLELPYIKECIVIPKKQEKNTLLIAKIYLEYKSENLKEDIEKINKSLPVYMRIDDYELMDKEFEKNTTRKIIRSQYAE